MPGDIDDRAAQRQHGGAIVREEPHQRIRAGIQWPGGAPVFGGLGGKGFTGFAPAGQPVVNKAPAAPQATQATQPAPVQTGQASGAVPNVAPSSPVIGPGFNVRADSQASYPEASPEIGQDNASDVQSQAETHGAGQADAGPRKRGGMTVFEKMMDGVRQARQTNRVGGSVKRSLSPADITAELREPQAANAANSDERAGHQQDLAPKGQTEDTLFDQNDGEEQLEIPAFLRRAN